MSWIHCSCGNEDMPEPTDRQIIESEYNCPRCDKDHSCMLSAHKSLPDILLSLLFRIEQLERKTFGESK